MSTKIDWAYKQADKLMCRTAFKDENDRISKIAAALRRAKVRGAIEATATHKRVIVLTERK
jgi:hypothetical protein